ncbi:hypothetical protein ACFWF7_18300 [Nocardia sp. NPDC060256]|uniref:hypothetical protein n=1 Tax=unclassified Nocardia TaxID=2637762 RepID=UPI003646E67E
MTLLAARLVRDSLDHRVGMLWVPLREKMFPGKRLVWLYPSDMVDQIDPGGPPT